MGEEIGYPLLDRQDLVIARMVLSGSSIFGGIVSFMIFGIPSTHHADVGA